MNVFNRLIMIIVAVLLVAVPVLLLLIGFGIIAPGVVSPYYRGAIDGFGGLVSNFDLGQGARALIAVISAIVALVALFLLMRELTFGRPFARRAVVEREPGKETALTAQAIKSLVEGAAMEAGADSPSCNLASERGRYEVLCDVQVPKSRNFTETASRARENIRSVLEAQRVPVKDIEVTVQGATSSSS